MIAVAGLFSEATSSLSSLCDVISSLTIERMVRIVVLSRLISSTRAPVFAGGGAPSAAEAAAAAGAASGFSPD